MITANKYLSNEINSHQQFSYERHKPAEMTLISVLHLIEARAAWASPFWRTCVDMGFAQNLKPLAHT